MATTEELANHREAILKAKEEGEFGRVLQILKVLKQEKVSAQTLKDSQVGKTMTVLSKLADFGDNADKVQTQKEASELLAAWKKVVEEEKKGQRKSQEEKKEEAKGLPEDHKVVKPLASDKDLGNSLKKQESMSAVDFIDFADVENFITKNKPRDAFRKSIFDILCKRCPPEVLTQKFQVNLAFIAMEVENTLDKKFAIGDRKYINKVRSIKFNLNDLENELAIKIINGVMPPSDLVTKETHELASEAKKKETEAVLADHQAASRTDLGLELQAKNAKEGLFRCGKCKKNKCSVFQMQTRGADEPMTNFVTCLSCGHNWKC